MKSYIFVLSMIIAMRTVTYAQVVDADYILDGKYITVKNYVQEETRESVHKLSFDFGESVLTNTWVIEQLSRATILKIDFVFTKYKMTSDFNQRQLNTKRIESFMEKAPHVFQNTAIIWNVYEQEEDPDREVNQKKFHGFVIYCRDDISSEKKSSRSRKPSTDALIVADYIDKTKCYKTEKKDIVRKKKSKRIPTGKYLPRSFKKSDSGVRYDNASIWKRRKEYYQEYRIDTVTIDVLVPDSTCMAAKYGELESSMVSHTISTRLVGFNTVDTVVSAVLNRNKNWKNMIIVEDVTGSMSPYIMQTLLWRKLNDKATRAKSFVFFNDGDSRPDGPIGRSGGAYYVSSTNDDDVEKTCQSTMNKGGGGAGPENNIEAILFAQTKRTELEEIVLVADNWAPVRDLSLLPQVKVPVHIIVCGAYTGNVNIDYLNIALATGGSVHTIEDDFNDLAKLTEGSTLTIGSQKYKVKKGKLTLVR